LVVVRPENHPLALALANPAHRPGIPIPKFFSRTRATLEEAIPFEVNDAIKAELAGLRRLGEKSGRAGPRPKFQAEIWLAVSHNRTLEGIAISLFSQECRRSGGDSQFDRSVSKQDGMSA
jgi:hypothetical protein